MSRPLFAVCLKSIALPAWEMIAPKTGQKNTVNFFGAWRLYGTSIGSQTTVPIKRYLQNEIIKALCSGERNQASSLLSELVSEKQDLESRDFVEILSYCASKPDPLFVMETWNLMKEKEIPVPPSRGFRYIIGALCKGGYLKEAFNILSTLEENSAGTLLLPLCNILLRASIEMHEFDLANYCLHLMEHRALGKSAITYALLLKLAVLQNDLSAVHEIWKECTNVYPMSILILRQFVWAFKSLKDLESANVALQIMVAVSFEGNSHLVRSSKGKPHLSRLDHDPLTLDICENSNIPTNLRHDYYTEENLSTSGFKFGLEAKGIGAIGLSLSPKPFTKDMVRCLLFSFNDVIHTCASLRNASLAEQLFYQMQNLGLEPSSFTYNGYARALAWVQGFQYGVEVLELMQQKNLKPHGSTLAALSVSCSKALELDLAENFLDQIPECTFAYPYNALFQACDTLDQPERAMRLYAKMKHLNVTPDIRTYEMLFKLFGNVNAPYEDCDRLSQTDAAKRIKAIEMDMRRHGIEHSYVSLRNLLKTLGMEGITMEVRGRLYLVEDSFFDGNTSTAILLYSNVLHSLVHAKEAHAAIEVFKCMISCGLTPDEVTYNTMIDCCSIIECYRSACALVSMMIRSGFCPDRVTYTTLTKVLLRLDDFDEALELFVLAHSEGIQLDRLYYNTVLQRAGEKGIIDLVELFVEQMHQDKIEPDTSTCERVFSAYANNGFNNTAMEALQVLSMRMISEDDDILNETRMKYENLIFSEDIDAESQIIQIFRTSPTLAAAMLQLRWCSIMGFSVSWSPNQSPWAKRLSLTHARAT